MGFWLAYQRGSFLLKEFHHSPCSAEERASGLGPHVAWVRLLDESKFLNDHGRALIERAIEVDRASNRLVLGREPA
jgi:hypothetical protein